MLAHLERTRPVVVSEKREIEERDTNETLEILYSREALQTRAVQSPDARASSVSENDLIRTYLDFTTSVPRKGMTPSQKTGRATQLITTTAATRAAMMIRKGTLLGLADKGPNSTCGTHTVASCTSKTFHHSRPRG